MPFESRSNSGEIAAIILEPVPANAGLYLPLPGFLQGLRDLCTREGAVLIFDEVMTGFRLARGGAQEIFKITPDLTAMGKVIGGGLPVGAYGGRADILGLKPWRVLVQAHTEDPQAGAAQQGLEPGRDGERLPTVRLANLMHLRQPASVKQLESNGFITGRVRTPKDMAAFIQSEINVWKPVIRKATIKLD